MALRGTLKDFGIADIFQLIGHQGKTGILSVRNRDSVVKIFFNAGTVVRAESSTRKKKELLGAMLIRAEVISEEQLNEALSVQKSTLRRLGDVMIEQGALDAKTLHTFAKLQTTETIYRLFLWDNGSYEFKSAEVDVDPDAERIRSENVLMEGFRQVDEWPSIRKRITGYGIVFEKLEDLDALSEAESTKDTSEEGGDDFDLDAAFGDFDEGGGGGSDSRLKNIGQNERIIYQLIQSDRDVQKIIDLSRLGEFESCKALVTLIDAAIIAPLAEKRSRPSADATVGGINPKSQSTWVPAVTRVALYVGLIAVVGYGAWDLGFSPISIIASRTGDLGFVATDLQIEMSRGQIASIREALEIYRGEKGSYPADLKALVRAGLLRSRDLSFPWMRSYYYRRNGRDYALLRPLY